MAKGDTTVILSTVMFMATDIICNFREYQYIPIIVANGSQVVFVLLFAYQTTLSKIDDAIARTTAALPE